MNQLNHFGHQGRFGFVRVGVGIVNNARVDIQHGSATGHLIQRVHFHGRKIARFQFGGQFLAAGRVDPLAYHAERLVKADGDGLGFALDNGAGHKWSLSLGLVGRNGGFAAMCDGPVCVGFDAAQGEEMHLGDI